MFKPKVLLVAHFVEDFDMIRNKMSYGHIPKGHMY